MDLSALDDERWLVIHGIGETGYVTQVETLLAGTPYRYSPATCSGSQMQSPAVGDRTGTGTACTSKCCLPDPGDLLTGKDGSLLQVSGAGGSLLLPGELMKKGQARLLAMASVGLRSYVLVAPHHGGNSSCTPNLGHRNGWGVSKPELQARYLPLAILADTATDCALLVHFRAGLPPAVMPRWRREQPAL